MKKRKKVVPHELNFTVVGLQYRMSMSTRRMLKARIKEQGPISCVLEREPRNHVDSNAIKVVINEKPYEKLHIGYLTRQVAGVLSPLIDRGDVEIYDVNIMEVWAEDGEAEVSVYVVATGKPLEIAETVSGV